MAPRASTIKLHSVCATLLAALVIVLPGLCQAQEAALNPPSTVTSPANEFFGVDRCEGCHRSPTRSAIKNNVTDFVLLNESMVWEADIHSKAFELIDPATSDLGKQICDKLGIASIHDSRMCLSCHSDWRPNQESPPPTYERGVACESCHGASEKWDVPHSKDTWRAKPIDEKESLGMIDVRHPVKRAEQCFGCHIGNAAEGKLITHEMYAAGHPPLPSIEIESFASQMPRHWRYLNEKIADARSEDNADETVAAPFVHFQQFLDTNHQYLKLGEGDPVGSVLGHHHRAAAVVLGGVVALRESIELMRDLSIEDQSAERSWPELAAFDCRACHHDLRAPSERQKARSGSVPGRPIIAEWPTALVRLAIRHVSEDRASYDKRLGEFQAKLNTVRSELQRSPFGSPSRVNAACSELSKWLTTEVIAPVITKPFDDRAVSDAINVLLVIGSTEPHDYDSARQIAWALRVLSCEGRSKLAVKSTVSESLEVLATSLRLNFANGTSSICPPVAAVDEPRQLLSLVNDLPTVLNAPVEFQPESFREQMQKLRESLR